MGIQGFANALVRKKLISPVPKNKHPRLKHIFIDISHEYDIFDCIKRNADISTYKIPLSAESLAEIKRMGSHVAWGTKMARIVFMASREYLNYMDNDSKGTNTFYISKDGIPSFAKIATQQRRRYGKFMDKLNANGYAKGSAMYNDIYDVMNSPEYKKEYAEQLQKLECDIYPTKLVYISENVYGEGEKKIQTYIQSHSLNGNIGIVSTDSDLFVMMLAIKALGVNNNLYLIHHGDSKIPNIYDIAHMIQNMEMEDTRYRDYVLLISLFGNDFIPCMGTLEMYTRGHSKSLLEILFDIYRTWHNNNPAMMLVLDDKINKEQFVSFLQLCNDAYNIDYELINRRIKGESDMDNISGDHVIPYCPSYADYAVRDYEHQVNLYHDEMVSWRNEVNKYNAQPEKHFDDRQYAQPEKHFDDRQYAQHMHDQAQRNFSRVNQSYAQYDLMQKQNHGNYSVYDNYVAYVNTIIQRNHGADDIAKNYMHGLEWVVGYYLDKSCDVIHARKDESGHVYSYTSYIPPTFTSLWGYLAKDIHPDLGPVDTPDPYMFSKPAQILMIYPLCMAIQSLKNMGCNEALLKNIENALSPYDMFSDMNIKKMEDDGDQLSVLWPICIGVKYVDHCIPPYDARSIYVSNGKFEGIHGYYQDYNKELIDIAIPSYMPPESPYRENYNLRNIDKPYQIKMTKQIDDNAFANDENTIILLRSDNYTSEILRRVHKINSYENRVNRGNQIIKMWSHDAFINIRNDPTFACIVKINDRLYNYGLQEEKKGYTDELVTAINKYVYYMANDDMVLANNMHPDLLGECEQYFETIDFETIDYGRPVDKPP